MHSKLCERLRSNATENSNKDEDNDDCFRFSTFQDEVPKSVLCQCILSDLSLLHRQ